jgi:hypothetical protein
MFFKSRVENYCNPLVALGESIYIQLQHGPILHLIPNNSTQKDRI